MREAGVSSVLDFFLGCGSSNMRLLCFDRTGTGIVVLDGVFGMSDSGRGSGCGSVMESAWIGRVGGPDVVQGCEEWWLWYDGTEC